MRSSVVARVVKRGSTLIDEEQEEMRSEARSLRRVRRKAERRLRGGSERAANERRVGGVARMNFCTSAMYHMQRPQLCAGHGQRHRPIKVGMAMRQLKLRGSAGPSYRRPDTIHATWARAGPAWPAPGRWLGQRTRWWAAGGRFEGRSHLYTDPGFPKGAEIGL